MVFTTIVFSFGDDWFSSLPGKTGMGSLWRPFWQDSHLLHVICSCFKSIFIFKKQLYSLWNGFYICAWKKILFRLRFRTHVNDIFWTMWIGVMCDCYLRLSIDISSEWWVQLITKVKKKYVKCTIWRESYQKHKVS